MTIDLVVLIGLPFYILVLLIQDKITHAMYVENWDAWNKVGAPGGWFWCPHERGWFDNLLKTRAFWLNNILGLADAALFPERIRRLYRIYYLIAFALIFIFIGGVSTLIYSGLSEVDN